MHFFGLLEGQQTRPCTEIEMSGIQDMCSSARFCKVQATPNMCRNCCCIIILTLKLLLPNLHYLHIASCMRQLLRFVDSKGHDTRCCANVDGFPFILIGEFPIHDDGTLRKKSAEKIQGIHASHLFAPTLATLGHVASAPPVRVGPCCMLCKMNPLHCSRGIVSK